jgi:hypothetical protein
VLTRGPDAGAVDIALDPSNPRVLYAGFWQVRRNPFHFDSGGPGSGLTERNTKEIRTIPRLRASSRRYT